MAKKKEIPPLEASLVLNTDPYAQGLKKAKATGETEGKAIDSTLGAVANKIVTRFLSVNAALSLAKKGYKEFVDKAMQLEKSGQGNDGTAAIGRISSAVDRMWTSFVRTVTESTAARAVLSAVAGAAEKGAVALGSWSGAVTVARGALSSLGAEVLSFLSDTGDKTRSFASSVASALGPLAGPKLVAQMADVATGGEASRMMKDMEAELREQAAFDEASQVHDKAVADARESAAASARSAADASRSGGSVVDTFVGSWQAGFARLADHFQNFSKDVGASLGGLKDVTVKALGDTFDSVAFLGPMLEKVYGQSAAGAARFQAAQLALAGGIAVVKSAMAFAEASDLLVEDPGASAAKVAAGVGYAGAAVLAGVAATRTLAGGRSGGGGGTGLAQSGNFRQERQQVTVVFGEVVGNEQWVREVVIPEIGRAVEADVVMGSSHVVGDPRFSTS